MRYRIRGGLDAVAISPAAVARALVPASSEARSSVQRLWGGVVGVTVVGGTVVGGGTVAGGAVVAVDPTSPPPPDLGASVPMT